MVRWPHTGEIIRGRGNYIALNRTYPEGWHIHILSALRDGARASIEARVPHDAMGVFFVAGFYELASGRIHSGTEYWVTERSEQPPTWRVRYTDRA